VEYDGKILWRIFGQQECLSTSHQLAQDLQAVVQTSLESHATVGIKDGQKEAACLCEDTLIN